MKAANAYLRVNVTALTSFPTTYFYDGDGVDRYLEPSAGTVICFRGDATNLHAVEKVTSGCRFALTALFHESSDPGPLFEAGGGGGDPYASWDALLRSAAETSLMAQDARRRDLLDDASSTPVAARLATDLRGDWCDARVAYDGEVVSGTGPAPDAVLVDLVAAALSAARADCPQEAELLSVDRVFPGGSRAGGEAPPLLVLYARLGSAAFHPAHDALSRAAAARRAQALALGPERRRARVRAPQGL